MNKEQKDKLLSILFLTWFFCSIILMIILKDISGYYTIMVFGNVFLVIGLMVGMKKVYIGYLFALVGLGAIVIPLLMLNPNLLTIDWDKAMPIIFLSLFILIGLGIAIVPIILFNKKKRLCNIIVPSKLIGYEENKYKAINIYTPIYEFEFNGEKYIGSLGKKIKKEEPGKIVDLRINPKDPSQIFQLEEDKKGLYFFIIFGLIIMIIDLFCLFLIFL